MPAEDRAGSSERSQSPQHLVAEKLTLDGQTATLVVVERDTRFSKFLFEYSILGQQVLNSFLLLSDERARHDDRESHPNP
jgi:hypothetical protein